jgi:hypothetical protein
MQKRRHLEHPDCPQSAHGLAAAGLERSTGNASIAWSQRRAARLSNRPCVEFCLLWQASSGCPANHLWIPSNTRSPSILLSRATTNNLVASTSKCDGQPFSAKGTSAWDLDRRRRSHCLQSGLPIGLPPTRRLLFTRNDVLCIVSNFLSFNVSNLLTVFPRPEIVTVSDILPGPLNPTLIPGTTSLSSDYTTKLC